MVTQSVRLPEELAQRLDWYESTEIIVEALRDLIGKQMGAAMSGMEEALTEMGEELGQAMEAAGEEAAPPDPEAPADPPAPEGYHIP